MYLLFCCIAYDTCNEISFAKIHELCKKCTPSQIMYQNSLMQHKVINEMFELCSTGHAHILLNTICTNRQFTFEMIRNNNLKIGMNTPVNKFYHINKQISLNNLNLSFVHFKRLMKYQFLKNGNT